MQYTLNDLTQLVITSAKNKCSDIHIKTGLCPYVRNVEGRLLPSDCLGALSVDEVKEFLGSLNKPALNRLLNGSKEVDAGASLYEGSNKEPIRLRLNAFYDQEGISLAIRILQNDIPAMTDLNLPFALQDLRGLHEGMILFCGETGSGKTTAMYSFAEAINKEDCKHIITLDDPTEILLHSKKSIISQREIGTHCDSFAEGLRSALRENPNVVLIGEMRDRASIATALMAAETGHLVLSSIHATTVSEFVDRILQYFPAEEHVQRRNEIAGSFRAVVGCHLFERAGGGRIGAYELLLRTIATAACIRDDDMLHIKDFMTGYNNMQTYESAVEALRYRRLIIGETSI